MVRSPALLFVFLAISGPAQGDPPKIVGQTAQVLKTLSLEELMEVDVTSVSRRPERVRDAPAAVSVVTGEDIRRSGASTLADALRLAEGLAVARFDAGTWAISSRGFANTVVNKMLVLIDGRSIYTPLFGGVFWDAQDTMLADVDRIEVVRGPAGTLWGANAVNGVINVITKTAGQTQGSLARFGTGTREHGFGAFRYGGRAGTGAFRVYGRSSYVASPRREDRTSAGEPRRMSQAGFRADWGEGLWGPRLTIQGDAYSGARGLIDRPNLDYWGANLLGRWQRSVGATAGLRVQAYIDHTHRQVPEQSWENRTTFDLELQHETLLARRHHLVWGGGYRTSSDRTRDTPLLYFEPRERRISITNLYAEDEIAIRPGRVWLTLGTKLEDTTFTGWELQPNARVRVRLDDHQTLWGAVSRAVRTPTRFDTDLRVTVGAILVARGSDEFRSEKLVAYEAGYKRRIGTRTSFDLSAFYNAYADLRTQEPSGPAGLPVVLMNKLNATARGLEASTSFQPHPRWLLHGSYAFLHLTRELDPDSRDAAGGFEANDPTHQVGIRSLLNLGRGFELDGFFRRIGELKDWQVPAYAELDLRLGWRREDLELSLIGRDLLHSQHAEFGTPGPARREFQRELVARATLRF